ncbi:MAG TPA: NADH-quinone oxidoreductase subunit J [Bryobacteraceae bacterium]|nr:NADH-quinone oxidoreductase subunit J [Bryobacteraceae bacterium]
MPPLPLDPILFLIFAGIAVLSAISLVLQKHPIASALSLVGVMVSLAVLYLLLGAEFIAAAQLVVYAGAIMVLFVFVIMLLNAGAEGRRGSASFAKWVSIPLLAAFIALLAGLIQSRLPNTTGVTFGAFTTATAREVGRVLFTQYLLPFEVTSILILVAILGAVVLARKEI